MARLTYRSHRFEQHPTRLNTSKLIFFSIWQNRFFASGGHSSSLTELKLFTYIPRGHAGSNDTPHDSIRASSVFAQFGQVQCLTFLTSGGQGSGVIELRLDKLIPLNQNYPM